MNNELLLVIMLLMLIVTMILLIILITRKQGPNADQMNDLIRHRTDELRTDMNETFRAMNDSSRKTGETIGRMLAGEQRSSAESQERSIAQTRRELTERQKEMQQALHTQMTDFTATSARQQVQIRDSVNSQLTALRQSVNEQMTGMDRRMNQMSESTAQSLDAMRRSMNESMELIRSENSKKLEEIRGTVDEKLQTTLEKRINESFRSVSEQLEKVNRGLGEMQTLAGDVGGLKKVLSGVKTRGILGEVQLGAILTEILAPEQYEANIATIPGSSERVEYAVRLPGTENGTVYLPIDSKFPGDRYGQLLEAQESGDRALIESAQKELEKAITKEAKDIREKYVQVPYTTNFGIMFLPFEGLYAEVVSRGMPEKLQRLYSINIAGPSTMAALLNSLQMGFKTLAIQKHSHEIFTVLTNVQAEFNKFGDVMDKMQNHLRQTSDDLDKLIGTRSRSIRRQLDKVQQMEDISSTVPLIGSDREE